MDVRIARHAGFCFGVRRATEALEAEIERAKTENLGRRVLTLGRIIHNDTYIEKIKSLGVEEIKRSDVPDVIAAAERGEYITVVVRAHGELAEVLCALEEAAKRNANFTLLDCTCPYVSKVRKIAAENSGENRLFILIGNENHPEVEGILSCATGGTLVFADSEDVKAFVNSSKYTKNFLS